MRTKTYIAFLLIFLKSNLILGQIECGNQAEIKQLGVEFCLPDVNWTITPEDKLKFISIHSSIFYTGTKTYTLRVEKLIENLSAEQYFNQQNKQIPVSEIIVAKGIKVINGKKFYFSKNHRTYRINNDINNKEQNSYNVTYYYSENKIGYSLSLVVSDENIDNWNEESTLKIWGSFKIVSLPENSIME